MNDGRFTLAPGELGQMGLSTLVLAVAFSIPLSCSRLLDTPLAPCPGPTGLDLALIGAVLPFALVIVFLAFVLHELAHKVLAQGMGLEAEYKASMPGLGLGLLVSAVLGVVLASPGVVLIWGAASRRDAGLIGIVGPGVNIALAVVCAFLSAALYPNAPGLPQGAAVGDVFHLGLLINAVLAAFNMVPVAPLDGSKVVGWSLVVFVLTWALILALLFVAVRTPADLFA